MRAKADTITTIAVAYLAGQGKTQADIARTLQLSQAAVSRILSNSPYLDKQVRYRFRQDGLSDQDMEAVLKRALVKQLAPRLDKLASENGHPRGPVLGVISTGENNGRSAQEGTQTFTAFTRQAAPHVRALLMRDAVRTCGVAWGYMLWDLTVALRALGAPRPWRRYPIQFIPLTGDPLQHREDYPPNLTSSNIAAELAEIANPEDAKRAPWLGIVPAFVPWKFQGAEIDVIEELVRMASDYEEIFRSGEGPALADNLDVILTSVGPADKPLGFGLGRLLRSIGDEKLDALKEQIHGDIGGVLLPKKEAPSELVEEIRKRWKGMEIRHLQKCAQEGFKKDDAASGRPGVVVLAMGRDRAEVILHAVERGLVNHLLIDTQLETALHELIDKLETADHKNA